MYQVKTEKFEGPLDLLLQLIEREEMDISEISLAKITDEYIRHLEGMDNLDPTEMADFLVVAAKLLWIKSKAILPSLQEPDEEGNDLANQLRLYKEFRDVSLLVHKMILKRRFTFVRERPLVAGEVFFNPPAWLTKEKLNQVLREILADLEPIVRLPRGIVKGAISIQEKIQEIRNMIAKNTELSFQSMIGKAKNKVEVIVNFLAVLELLKQKTVSATQNKLFGDINIEGI
jgi:segregation and condensation protein A